MGKRENVPRENVNVNGSAAATGTGVASTVARWTGEGEEIVPQACRGECVLVCVKTDWFHSHDHFEWPPFEVMMAVIGDFLYK